MTIQEWKAKINSYFQPKTTAERQKMMKYLVVFPAAILSGVVILWLLYSSLNKEDAKTGNAFNTEIPAGESEKIGTKVQEYEAADAAKKNRYGLMLSRHLTQSRLLHLSILLLNHQPLRVLFRSTSRYRLLFRISMCLTIARLSRWQSCRLGLRNWRLRM